MAVNRYPLLPPLIGFNKEIYPKEPVIYRIVNSVNNKCYVGQTTVFRKRLSKHYGALSNNKHVSLYLQRSFNKHGVDNFYVEILEVTTKELICEREIYWIEKFDSSNRDLGYNILVNTPSPWYGKRSLLHCQRISAALLGKHVSDETKKKQSEARLGRFKGKSHPFAKAVIQYDKNMNFINEFESILEAGYKTTISSSSISNNINGRSKYAGGFIWIRKEGV